MTNPHATVTPLKSSQWVLIATGMTAAWLAIETASVFLTPRPYPPQAWIQWLAIVVVVLVGCLISRPRGRILAISIFLAGTLALWQLVAAMMPPVMNLTRPHPSLWTYMWHSFPRAVDSTLNYWGFATVLLRTSLGSVQSFARWTAVCFLALLICAAATWLALRGRSALSYLGLVTVPCAALLLSQIWSQSLWSAMHRLGGTPVATPFQRFLSLLVELVYILLLPIIIGALSAAGIHRLQRGMAARHAPPVPAAYNAGFPQGPYPQVPYPQGPWPSPVAAPQPPTPAPPAEVGQRGQTPLSHLPVHQ